MAVARHAVVVDRPCAEVFDLLADPRTHHRWQPQLHRTETLTDGPVGVGTRAVERGMRGNLARLKALLEA